jgi:hypothetical protein
MAVTECGDDVCNSNENCSSCSVDCGSCPVSQNHVPTQSKPLLRASDYPYNTTDADLICYNQSTADADRDKVVNHYRWFRDSTFLSGWTDERVVLADYTEPGQRWVCEITPYDGKAYGTAMNSSPLLIREKMAVTECGDDVCEPGESCEDCSADCGSCDRSSSGGGGGGGSLSILPSSTVENLTVQNSTGNDMEPSINEAPVAVKPLMDGISLKESENQNIALIGMTGNAPDNTVEQIDYSASAVNEQKSSITANTIAGSSGKVSWIGLIIIVFAVFGILALYPGIGFAKVIKPNRSVYEVALSDDSAGFIDIGDVGITANPTLQVESLTQPVADAESSDLVLKAVTDMGYDKSYAEQLHGYAKAALMRGYGLDRIIQELLNVGWDLHVINNISRMYANTNPSLANPAPSQMTFDAHEKI